MNNVIKVKNVSFKYDEQVVLKNINLKVAKGDFLALLGSNGSGKTTLMKLIIGELKASSGSIELLGENVSNFKSWSKIGYISQQVKEFNQSFPATVREVIAANLYFKMGYFKLLKKELSKKIDESLKLLDMYQYKDRQIGKLSGGQQQRVFIARTLVTDPEIIFLDEPLVGVDENNQKEFMSIINKLNRELGISIVMISHDIHIVSSEANKIACFSDGDLFLHSADDFTYDDYVKKVNNDRVFLPEHDHSEESDSYA
ncbi:metal ABC transporter ATP-binding protein [Natronospora cellulosivora (SeqCode)]